MNASAPVIHATHLSKRYGDVQAVKEISFDIYPGEIFAVLGPNGAGKTTTIRMTLGLIKPDHGERDDLRQGSRSRTL